MARSLEDVTLEDKYSRESGIVMMSGVQALLRLPMMQRELDRSAGLNTGGFISGYRGSPLGGLDSLAARETKRLAAHDVRFLPGVNEDLAATSVWGTQQIDAFPGAKVDGVFAMWYGKGPGVDRSADVIRHANSAGTHRHGGVLLVYGDDHPGKSSSIAHQSELVLSALNVPSLYPANVQEFLRFGLLGWALSRYCGLWVGFKCVNETVEQTATVDLTGLDAPTSFPSLQPHDLPPAGINIDPRAFAPAEAEKIVLRQRLPLVHRFVRANGLNRVARGAEHPRLGLVSAGKSYLDCLRALELLGLDAARLGDLGIGLWKVGCIWPLEPEGLKAFAQHADALLFIEEKKPVLEDQARRVLYDADIRPKIWGKQDDRGRVLLPSDVPFDPIEAARALYRMIRGAGLADEALEAAYHTLVPLPDFKLPGGAQNTRTPFFCSGCPHNTSTQLPEGSFAMSGIGCHTMVVFNGRDTTLPPTQMGGEGANWIGMAPFSGLRHIFQNLGDGTYFHSGLLAIRAAVAANVSVTYKILYNDAVAMTGGQPLDRHLSVGAMVAQVRAEGVVRVVVVSADPYTLDRADLPPNTEVFHRDSLTSVQKQLRETEGVTAIIYQQTCAAEKRRRRKRKKLPEPDFRIVINENVCEGCGDCSEQSGCVSIMPRQTSFGIKRQIDQSSCNKDASCLKGFCPSFLTLSGGVLRQSEAAVLDEARLTNLPPVDSPKVGARSVLVTGIGGTGVVTVGAVLAMAAHLEGKAASVYDMTGLAQKNGAVFSHLRIGASAAELGPQRIGQGETDTLLAFDAMAATTPEVLKTLAKGRTRAIVNSTVQPGAFFQMAAHERGLPETASIVSLLADTLEDDACAVIDVGRVAEEYCRDSLAINMMMVGYAVQSASLPLGVGAVERAIELNGVSVPFNLRAFRIGRLMAADPNALGIAAKPEQSGRSPNLPRIDAAASNQDAVLLDLHRRELGAYQGRSLVAAYDAVMARLHLAEKRAGVTGLVRAAAPVLSRLMRYKDEYEVARLHTDPAFRQRLLGAYAVAPRVTYHLAPPFLGGVDAGTGRPAKRAFGSWILPAMHLLARLRWLRGTALDPFGRSAERKAERALVPWYSAVVDTAVAHVTPDSAGDWIAILGAADQIRGYGPVKEKNRAKVLAETEARIAALLC